MSDVQTYVMVDGQQVEGSLAPKDRTFRNAWSLEDGEIVIDLDKAKKIQLDKIRQERAPLLAQLDVDYQRADEEGDDARKAEIVAQKNVLRNVTKDKRVLNAKNPDDLSELDLEALTNK